MIVTFPQTLFPFIVVYIYVMYLTLTKLRSLEFGAEAPNLPVLLLHDVHVKLEKKDLQGGLEIYIILIRSVSP